MVLLVIKGIPKPSMLSKLDHPDWISSVQYDKNELLTASYDGAVRVFSTDKKPKMIREIRDFQGFVKKASFTSNGIVCGGQNGLLKYFDKEGNSLMETCAHSDTLTGLSVDGNFVVSSSVDGSIKLWSLESIEEEKKGKDAKKRKTTRIVSEFSAPVTYEGHGASVPSVIFEGQSIHSVSWDHSFRHWEVESKSCVQIWNCDAAFNGLDKSQQMFATSHSDSFIRFWESSSTVPVLKINQKDHFAHCVKFVSSFEVAALSSTGLRMWDLRGTNKPLLKMDFAEKRLDMAFFDDSVAVGGENGILEIYSLNKLD